MTECDVNKNTILSK